jgi:hypothetical protein
MLSAPELRKRKKENETSNEERRKGSLKGGVAKGPEERGK